MIKTQNAPVSSSVFTVVKMPAALFLSQFLTEPIK
jgi:hypothetical protein